MKLNANANQKIRKLGEIILKFLPALSYIPPFFILYMLDPVSFNYTWKGRTYYIFFMWAIFLETILYWDDIIESWRVRPRRVAIFLMALSLPTLYVFATNFVGFDHYKNFNELIIELSRKCGIGGVRPSDIGYFTGKMPLAIEYLTFTVIFDFILLLGYGINGVAKYPISSFLLGLIGFIYLIDNLFPYGLFMPLQFLVPSTTFFAAHILNLMGHRTTIVTKNDPIYGFISGLKVEGLKTRDGAPHLWPVWIAWPCAGVDSLLIYSITILTFLRGQALSRKQKILFFMLGAIVTYFLNILRVVTILIIGTVHGVGSDEWLRFHDYYGPLYSMTWIATYPLIIIVAHSVGRKIWKKFQKRRQANSTTR